MVALYTVTIFLSAALLFFVQPMFARLVLPLLGGSPAVWNTAMVFYQATLLAGYAYAHASAAWLGARRAAALHLVVLLLPLAVLPIAIPAGWSPPTETNPALWLLALMSVAVGLPLFVVSATSPLLQMWFAATRDRRAGDPFFLYAASNAGSLLALVAYPAWVEPLLRLGTQSRLWAWGYGALAVALGGCVVLLWKNSSPPAPALVAKERSPSLTTARRLRWVLLAFAPSSLLLGVTTFLSSEIAAVPLLWVIPLGLYLLTFVFAFASRQIFPRTLLVRALPIALVPLVLVLNLQATQPIAWLLLLHLVVLFLAALLCHARLAADRPGAAHVTEFYLWISVGGVLGGVFNALLAPLVFNSIAEYPLTLVLVAWLALQDETSARAKWSDAVGPLVLGVVTLALVLAVGTSRWRTESAVAGLVFGAPALAAYFLSKRPLRFALGLAALLVAGLFYRGEKGRVLYAERSFFGVHRVTLDPSEKFHLLVHGMTLHGTQSLDRERSRDPLTYYHRTGPIGDVFGQFGRDPFKQIGAVGLGAGSLASYAQPRQPWTYFEIDPVVLKLARDGRYFTFLRDSPAEMRIVLGDARLSLAREPDAKFSLLVLDAYSSDAIPVHLVTREALALYVRKLAPGGVLAFHISNLHLDLEPVFANLARDAQLVCLTREDTALSQQELALGKAPSVWLVMARRADDLDRLAANHLWRPARGDSAAVWSDDFSSLLSVFRWR